MLVVANLVAGLDLGENVDGFRWSDACVLLPLVGELKGERANAK